jgi:hypothetical protein
MIATLGKVPGNGQPAAGTPNQFRRGLFPTTGGLVQADPCLVAIPIPHRMRASLVPKHSTGQSRTLRKILGLPENLKNLRNRFRLIGII